MRKDQGLNADIDYTAVTMHRFALLRLNLAPLMFALIQHEQKISTVVRQRRYHRHLASTAH